MSVRFKASFPIKFINLGLPEPIAQAVRTEGYDTPTPIQEQAIPHILAGRDVLGSAQTGTGKTAAFALPMLALLSKTPAPAKGVYRPIRALILTPTRELAAQIAESVKTYGRHTHLTHALVFGGVNQNPQTRALDRGVDILIATPGRLLDLLNQGYGDLSQISIFILDEADRMLDMGFINDIRKIIARLPRRDAKHPRQTLLFSATMPPDIKALADTLLHDPVHVKVAPDKPTADRIDQCVYHVDRRYKPALLRHLLEREHMTRVVVFTRTKHGADRVARDLNRAGITAEAIHGNKRQSQRQRTIAGFKSGDIPVLVATDIAARGIDIDDVTHVINYDIPEVPETYVHRIGRTARAGASGDAITFCSAEERPLLRDVERFTRNPIRVQNDHPPLDELPAPERAEHDERRERPDHRRGGQPPRGGRRPQREGSGAGHPRSADRSPRPRNADSRGDHRDSRTPHHDGRPTHGGGDRPRSNAPARDRGDAPRSPYSAAASDSPRPRDGHTRDGDPRENRPRDGHPRAQKPRAPHGNPGGERGGGPHEGGASRRPPRQAGHPRSKPSKRRR